MRIAIPSDRGERIPLFCWVFLIAVFTKQFYLLSSGSFQIGDLLFALSFLLMISDGKPVRITKENKDLFYFVMAACLIDGIYSAINMTTQIVISAVFFIFNFLVVLTFDRVIRYDRFLVWLEWVVKACILFQLGLYLSGNGRWYMECRYEGTFNDPNQYGFFMLSTFFMLVLLLKMHGKTKQVVLWFVITFFLIVPCASSSMLVGLVVFLVFYFLFAENVTVREKRNQLCIAGVFLVVFFLLMKGVIPLPESFASSFMYERTMDKIESFEESSSNFLQDRGLYKVIYNPFYILIGAGEGAYWRFAAGGEIHSSVVSILWCYGIVPFSWFAKWCIQRIRGISKSVWCVYLALLVETLTLVNHRQPMFWMILVIAGHEWLKAKPKEEEGVGGDESHVCS